MMTERKAAYPCTSCSVIGKQHCGKVKTCERYLEWFSQEWTIIREAAEARRRRARRGKEKERMKISCIIKEPGRKPRHVSVSDSPGNLEKYFGTIMLVGIERGAVAPLRLDWETAKKLFPGMWGNEG